MLNKKTLLNLAAIMATVGLLTPGIMRAGSIEIHYEITDPKQRTIKLHSMKRQKSLIKATPGTIITADYKNDDSLMITTPAGRLGCLVKIPDKATKAFVRDGCNITFE